MRYQYIPIIPETLLRLETNEEQHYEDITNT